MAKVTIWHKSGKELKVEPVDARELLKCDEYSDTEPSPLKEVKAEKAEKPKASK